MEVLSWAFCAFSVDCHHWLPYPLRLIITMQFSIRNGYWRVWLSWLQTSHSKSSISFYPIHWYIWWSYELFLSQTSKWQSKSSRTNRTTSRTLQRHSTALTGTKQSQKAENSKLARKQPTFTSSTLFSLYKQHNILTPFIQTWITYNLLECFFA